MRNEIQLILFVKCPECGEEYKAFERHLFWICPKCKFRFVNPLTKKDVQRFKEEATEQ